MRSSWEGRETRARRTSFPRLANNDIVLTTSPVHFSSRWLPSFGQHDLHHQLRLFDQVSSSPLVLVALPSARTAKEVSSTVNGPDLWADELVLASVILSDRLWVESKSGWELDLSGLVWAIAV